MRQGQNQSLLEKVYLHLLRSRWTKVASVLASVVVFCTVYALILPAITLSSQATKCGFEEHTHTAECYDAENNLICGLEEHTHTLACYSDPNADVEGWDVWTADIPELTGDPRADIVAIAASQVGYKESDKNYLVSNENQTQGYTRYGHWYGDVIDGSGERLANGLSEYAYADWDAIFVSFILDRAGVLELGSDSDAGNWAGALGASGYYADAADYTPQAGDLIFFTPEAGASVKVGIITDVNKGFFGLFGNTIHSFSVIAGNSDNSVQEIKVAVDSREDGDITFETIHGYGIIPSKENKTDYSVSEEIKGSPADADQSVPVDEATADQAAAEVAQSEQAAATEEGNTEAAAAEQPTIPADESTAGQPVVPADESTAGQPAAPADESTAGLIMVPTDEIMTGGNVAPADESTVEQNAVPADESMAGTSAVPADESSSELAGSDNSSVTDQETVPADVTTAEEAIIAAQESEEQNESVVPGLAEDTDRIVGKSEKDLESADVTEKDGVTVSVAEYHLTDDGTALIMNWKAETQLEEGVLPAGAIIRIDTATGKNHGLTATQAKSWGGAAVIFGESTALADNDNYEITFIGDNGNLYTWADVQGMSEESVVTFTGIHVKALNDVKASRENNSVELAFETTAKIADANAGMNYYVTKVSINGKTGSETFSYKNGEAVPVDQDKVLQDAGLVNNANVETLTAKKSDYIVTMSYGPEAGIPEGSKLYVKEIRKGTEEYNTYIEDAKAALGINGAAEAELQGRFFDIKIMTKDGEYEPKAPVSVNIEYRDAIETQDASYVSAVHFSKDGTESIPVDTTDISAAQDDMAMVKAVEFSAESFSVYGVVYTVDFEYVNPASGQRYYYNLAGGSNINLTDLLVVLGVKNQDEVSQFVAEEVADVKFSNPELVHVTRIDEKDWLLESIIPFDSQEVLTISLKNGDVIKIKVTDAQAQPTNNLNELISGFNVTGATLNSDGTYTVLPGKKYKVEVSFQESDTTKQFADTQTLTYTLPDGLKFESITSPFNIPINILGIKYTITGNNVSLSNQGRTISITLNQSDPHFTNMQEITTLVLNLEGEVVFDKKEGQEEYHVDGGGTYKVDKDSHVDITKTGKVVNFDTGLVEYTLTVVSNGSNDSVSITDKITGDALTYNGDAKLYDPQGALVKSATTDGNGFTLDTGTLVDGRYTITYSATLNKSNLDEDINNNNALGTASDTNNTVTWNGNKQRSYNLNNIVPAPGKNKYSTKSTTNDSTKKATTEWVIEADSNYTADWQLKNVTDRIKTPGVTYSGEGIYVEITDPVTHEVKTGSTPVFIPWSLINRQKNADNTWTWTYDMSQIPDYDNTGKYWHYKIFYTTEYDVSDILEDTTFTNEVTTNNSPDPKEGTATVSPTTENKTDIIKEAISVKSDKITWQITLTIPAKGVDKNRAKVIEYLPSSNNGKYKDLYVANSFAYVRGHLEEDGLPDVNVSTDKSVVTFSWGENGFAQSPSQRQVVFTFETLNNEDWLKDESVDGNHKNHAEFNGTHKYADAEPVLPTFKKEGSELIKGNDGEIYFDFDVSMNTITEASFEGSNPITFTDTYDPHLEYVDGSAKIYAGDKGNEINRTYDHCVPGDVYIDTEAHTIEFSVSRNDLPGKNQYDPDTGQWPEVPAWYSFYRLHYRMKVKDISAISTEALGTKGFTVKMDNRIESKVGNDETTVEYTPDILDKQQISTESDENGRIEFLITVNEARANLSSGDVIKLTDYLTNLSVQYHDITVSVEGGYQVQSKDAAGNSVTVPYFNMSGNNIEFYLPDEHKVEIRYFAKPVGKPEDDGEIHYSNTADLDGYKKTVEESEEYKGEAGGAGTNYGVKLYKANANVNSQLLPNAVFKLFIADEVDENGLAVSGTPMRNTHNEDITFTTNGTDEIDIKGTNATTGWNLRPEQVYYLQEIQAPPGYAIDTRKYQFTISQQGYVNYSGSYKEAPDGSGAILSPWTFYNGDVVTVKEYPKKGELVLEKSFSGIDPSKLDDDQKAAIKFIVYKRANDGNYEEIKTIGYEVFTDNTYTIGDLEAGTYKVVEIVNDVNCKETVYSVTNGAQTTESGEDFATVEISSEDLTSATPQHKVTVTNTYDVPSEFKIYKYANYAGVEYQDVKLPGAQFGVFEYLGNDQIGETPIVTKETNSRGRLFFTVGEGDGAVKIQYNTVYCVKETKEPVGYKRSDEKYYICFLSQGNQSHPANAPGNTIYIGYKDGVQKEVPNDIGTTSLGVEKIWQNIKLEPDNTNTTPIKVRIKQIASYDKAGQFVENSETGFYPNAAIQFEVVKEGEDWKIQQPDDVVLESPLRVDETTGKIFGLPAIKYLANGTPVYYHYEVEEVNPGNYTPSYSYGTDEDGSTIATVTNRPNSVKSFVKVKAEKRWIDTENNDVSDTIDANTVIPVDVYRVEGVLKAGKLYENGVVSEKDVQKLFGVTFTLTDGAERGKINTSSLVCYPHDQIQVVVTSKGFEPGHDIAHTRIEIKQRNKQPMVCDISDGKHYICTFEAEDEYDLRQVEIKSADFAIGEFEVEVRNLTAEAEGRTQVLTQEEAENVRQKKIVDSLTLQQKGGWKAESKEFSGGTAETVYSYFLVEPEGKKFDASYSIDGDTIVITNVDKKLKVDKKWFKSDGTTEIHNDNGEIVYKLYQITIPAEFQEYTHSGNIKLNTSNLIYNTWTQEERHPVFAGNAVDGKIKPGSTVEIVFTTRDPHNSSLEGELTYVGCDLVSDVNEQQNDDNGQFSSRTRTIVVNNVAEGFTISGSIHHNDGDNRRCMINVLREPSGATPPTPEEYKNHLVATVTMKKNEVTSSFSEEFAQSGMVIKEGNGDFTSFIDKLPALGPNGETYSYFVEEVSTSTGFEQQSITQQPVEAGSTVIIGNKQVVGSVEVTKAFSGISRLPADFKITATYNDGESDQSKVLSVSDSDVSGNGTSANPYKWVINNIPVGTEVTFTETGITVEGYTVTITGTATSTSDTAASATAIAAKDTPGQASFVNTYSPLTGELKVTKAAAVGSDAAGKEFTFEAVLTPTSDATIDLQKLKVEDAGTLIKTEPASTTKGTPVTVTFKVTGTGTAKITGIPLDTSYEVTEPSKLMPDGWKQTGTVVYSNAQKTVSTSDSTDTVTITNEKVPFEFYKEWKDSEQSIGWPEKEGQKVSIEVKVGRKEKGKTNADTYEKTYVIGGSNLQNNKEISSKEGDSPKLKVTVTSGTAGAPDQYKFSLEGLDYYSEGGAEYEYFVTETEVADGYKLSYYKLGNATFAADQSVTDGGTIVNATEESFELPHTGGIGTHPYRAAGIIMVITALLGVFLVKRREHRHNA